MGARIAAGRAATTPEAECTSRRTRRTGARLPVCGRKLTCVSTIAAHPRRNSASASPVTLTGRNSTADCHFGLNGGRQLCLPNASSRTKAASPSRPKSGQRLEAAISEIRTVRTAGPLSCARATSWTQSTLLLEGFMSRYIDDRNGLRQLVAVHVPGDFVDLHAYPLKVLDHDVATITAATVAIGSP